MVILASLLMTTTKAASFTCIVYFYVLCVWSYSIYSLFKFYVIRIISFPRIQIKRGQGKRYVYIKFSQIFNQQTTNLIHFTLILICRLSIFTVVSGIWIFNFRIQYATPDVGTSSCQTTYRKLALLRSSRLHGQPKQFSLFSCLYPSNCFCKTR